MVIGFLALEFRIVSQFRTATVVTGRTRRSRAAVVLGRFVRDSDLSRCFGDAGIAGPVFLDRETSGYRPSRHDRDHGELRRTATSEPAEQTRCGGTATSGSGRNDSGALRQPGDQG
jgi:hypothetical protein